MEQLRKTTFINITHSINNLLNSAIKKALPNIDIQAITTPHPTGAADYTSPTAVNIFNKNKNVDGWTFPSSKEVAEEILAQMEPVDFLSKIEVSQVVQNDAKKDKKKKKDNPKKEKKPQTPNYFINFTISDDWIMKNALGVVREGISLDSVHRDRKVLVDYSSPNIAKEMHVGHMRSTILGETICRLLEYLGNDVHRINHIGDWGTQFGMLIANMEEKFPNYADNMPDIEDLESFYAESKAKFKEDEQFKAKAQERTVALQSGDENVRKAWKIVCDISKKEFDKIYARMGVNIKEVGESFYNDMAKELAAKLQEDGKVIKDDGAMIMRCQGYKQPLMIVKSDGGLTYDSSDLAAIHYRLKTIERDWVIYVVGKEQDSHFQLIFQGAKELGWHKPPATRVDHAGFGMMLGKDGKKLSSSKGGALRLKELLDNAKEKAKERLAAHKKEGEEKYSEEFLEEASEKLGISSLRYFDLKQHRMSDYKFDLDKMLDDKGNTAVYLLYSYVRILSIYRKNEIKQEEIKDLAAKEVIEIVHPKERKLLLHVLKFNDVIDSTLDDLCINKLTDFLYETASLFSEFYNDCIVKGNNSRILITELVRLIMQQCFDILGITHIEKI